MGFSVEIGGPSVIAGAFNNSAGQSAGSDVQMDATVTPSQLFKGAKIPASATNADKYGMK